MIRLALLGFLVVTPAFGQAIVLSTCGSANYSDAIGTLHQLTMNTAGYLCASTTTTMTERERELELQRQKQQEPQK